MKSQNLGFSQSRRKTVQLFLLPVILILLVLSVVVFVVVLKSRNTVPDDLNSELNEYWEAEDYLTVLTLSDTQLLSDPLDSTLLMYNGFSHFYYAITLVSHDERISHLDSALYSLRKLLLNPPKDFVDEISYILGKVYFHKGRYYYDSAKVYLQAAYEDGFQAEDLYEYLGVVNLDLGNFDSGIGFIMDAIDIEPRDILFYTAAEAYERNGDLSLAEDFYRQARKLTSDSYLSQESSIGLARVLYTESDFSSALEILQSIVEENSQAAEAFFYIGEIYNEMGDMVKARANWREAYNQDKTFGPALERLQS